MPSKFDINPATGRQYGVNPATGVQDDNYWANVVEPSLKARSGSGSGSRIPTADDILREQKAKLTEQVTFLKDFLSANPLGFDEAMAREAASEKYKPYYTEVLADFVTPIQKRIAFSSAEENRALTELTRSTELGEKQTKRATSEAIARAREGFAGAGLFGSGLERGETARQETTGKETLTDFLARSEFTKQGTQAAGTFERDNLTGSIANKERDIFGRGREFETAITTDTESQRQKALKTRSLRALEAVSSRFGSPLSDIPNYLELYNQ